MCGELATPAASTGGDPRGSGCELVHDGRFIERSPPTAGPDVVGADTAVTSRDLAHHQGGMLDRAGTWERRRTELFRMPEGIVGHDECRSFGTSFEM